MSSGTLIGFVVAGSVLLVFMVVSYLQLSRVEPEEPSERRESDL